jgi:hypothetical protein
MSGGVQQVQQTAGVQRDICCMALSASHIGTGPVQLLRLIEGTALLTMIMNDEW